MSSADRPPVEEEHEAPVSLGHIDFSTHVLSMASSAMVALGQMPAPGGDAMELDIETARYLIDVIAMLETKTRGNLDESEEKLLQSLLYDLRVAFVDASKR
jgi:hypothetical protein